MDRILRHQLRAIAADHTSGATELADLAATAILHRLDRQPEPKEREFVDIARHLYWGKASIMAPLFRLMNEVLLAIDEPHPSAYLRRSCGDFRQVIRNATVQISRRFAKALRRYRIKRTIVTHSYSSTVVAALIHARRYIRCVICSEGRPAFEGRKTARALVAARMRVSFTTDVALPMYSNPFEDPAKEGLLIITGADQIREKAIVNKGGTELLLERAHNHGTPAWILADSTKIVVEAPHLYAAVGVKPGELWPDAPRGVTEVALTLEHSRVFPTTRLLTERGWMNPRRLRAELLRIPISPRLEHMLD